MMNKNIVLALALLGFAINDAAATKSGATEPATRRSARVAAQQAPVVTKTTEEVVVVKDAAKVKKATKDITQQLDKVEKAAQAEGFKTKAKAKYAATCAWMKNHKVASIAIAAGSTMVILTVADLARGEKSVIRKMIKAVRAQRAAKQAAKAAVGA